MSEFSYVINDKEEGEQEPKVKVKFFNSFLHRMFTELII